MARDPRINVTITGDSKGLEKAFKASGDAVNSVGGTIKRSLVSSGVTAALGLLSSGIESAFSFANTGIANADALGDSVAILDKNTKGLGQTVNNLDLTALGFDDVETAKAAESISSAAEALGLTDKEATKLVPGLTKLAAGYSALSGADAATAGDLFAKAMGGSAKAAKELGVELKKGATPAENYQAILAKWGPLAEDAATGSRSLADEQATLDAKMSDLSTAFGGFLSEALAPVVAFIVDQLFPALEAFWKEHGPAIMDILKTLGEVFGEVFGFIASEIVPIAIRLAGVFAKAFGPVLQAAGAAFQSMVPILTTLWGIFKTNIVPILETLIGLWASFYTAILKVAGFIAGAFTAAFKGIQRVVDGVIDVVEELLDVLGQVGDFIRNNPLANIAGGIGDIIGGFAAPTTAAAGVMFPTTAAAGTGRVAAARAGGGSAGGVTINFNGLVTDPVSAGREVSRVLGEYTRRGGILPSTNG